VLHVDHQGHIVDFKLVYSTYLRRFLSSTTPTMPEKGVIGLFLREIKGDEYELLKKKIHRDHQDDDEYFSGERGVYNGVNES
jgi:hypothetical protein